jgi:hypothetical protein
MVFSDIILSHLNAAPGHRADSVVLCHACGVEEADLDAEKAQAFEDALLGLEADGRIHWAEGNWNATEDRRVLDQRITAAVLRRFLETGKASTREHIADVCGVSASTVGKWLQTCAGVPRGCSYELRSRRGGGGGPGKEHFYPRIHELRDVILRGRE